MHKKLKEIASLIGGYAFKSKNYIDNGLRVVRIANVQDGYFSDESPCYYPLTIEKELGEANLIENDLLMSLTGNIGRVAFLPADALPAGLNQRVECIRTNNIIAKRYLYHFFQSKKFKNDAEKNSTGVAQLNLSTTWLGNYEIPLFDEQKTNSIVSTFDKINNCIDGERENIKHLDTLVKSRFNELFSNETTNVTVNESCEVHARIGWQALTQKEHMKEGTYMLITGTDFENNEINYSNCVFVSKERYEMDPKIILKNDDVLITKDGTIGKVAIVHNLPGPATLNSGVFVIRPDRRFNKEYISYVFKGEPFSKFVEEVKTGVTIKHLNQQSLLKFSIPVPSIERQNEFASFVELIDKLKFIYPATS